MKNAIKWFGVIAIVVVIGFSMAGCRDEDDDNSSDTNNDSNNSNPSDTVVTLSSVTANGSSSETTTKLTLTFSQAITGLSAKDITLSGVSGMVKGTLGGSGKAYTLPISGFSSGGTLSVAVAKSGYTFSGSPKTATVFYSGGSGGDIEVTFSNLSANGSAAQTTTQLTLTFSQAITGLSAGDITLSGVSNVSKGTLSGSGPVYTLPISGFSSGGTLSVSVAKSGYTISGSPKTAIVFYSGGGGDDIEAWLRFVSADGSNAQTTTYLGMEFSDVIQGLSATDITLSGVEGVIKGTFNNPREGYYTLDISGFTSSGTLTVAISKPGYIINSPTTVDIFYYSAGGGNSGLIAEWYNSQEDADAGNYWQTPVYQFTANGDFYHNGNAEGYSYSATNDAITLVSYYGIFIGTADYSISGTKLTLSNVTGNILVAGDYYKQREIVSFDNVTANGSTTQTTTQLTLTFDMPIPGLSADDITLTNVSGVSKGNLSGSGPTYTLPISGFSSSGTLSVAVAKSGYAISGSSRTVSIFSVSEVTFTGLSANGSSTQTTTQLTLIFSQTIPGLTANDITLSGVSGVSKGTLSGSGSTYTLGISGVTANGTLSVAVAKSGYNISGSPKTVTVYYYYVAPQPNTNPPGTPTLGATRSGINITMTWSFPTGSSYGSPTSIKVRLYDPQYEVWVDVETLAGTATSYTFNYTMWRDSSTGGVMMGIIGENSYGTGSRAGTFNTNTNVFY